MLATLVVALSGCKDLSKKPEREARQDLRTVTETYRPGGARPQLPRLTPDSGLDAAEIALTVAVAEKAFAWREISRNLALRQDRLIPQAGLSVEVARAGYLSGTISFFNLIEPERQRLAFELSEVAARTRREIVLADLGLLVAGIPSEGSPLPRAGQTSVKPPTETHASP